MIFLLLNLLQGVVADMPVMDPYYPEDGTLPRDNIFAGAILAMSACTCIGIVCKSLPISITDEDDCLKIESDKTETYKQDIRKLKRDLR